MDRILDSGSNDKGSIPFGSTNESQLSKVGSFCFCTFGLLWRNLQANVVQMWFKCGSKCNTAKMGVSH